MSRGLRIALKTAALLIALLVILVAGGAIILRSAWFNQKLKQRIVAELERATGGGATLGDFAFDWRLLSARVNDLTLHGTEPKDVPPLLQAKSIEVGLKIISL